MSTMTTSAEALLDLMEKYNAYRSEAERRLGSGFDEARFNAWFTLQATGAKK